MDPRIYQKMRAVEDEHWWFVARRRIVAKLIESLPLAAAPDILDAGCGTGGNLALLKRYGRVTAMEMDNHARQLAQRRRLAEVLPGHLPDALPFTAQRFDLVVMLDVLEHIRDDSASLAAVAGLLKTGGRIVLTVPAFPLLWGTHDQAHHHQRRYHAASLQAAVDQAGLETEYMTYFNTWLFPLIAPVRLLQRLLPRQNTDTELSVPPAMLNALLGRVFASESRLLPRLRLPFGVSLLAVLKSREN